MRRLVRAQAQEKVSYRFGSPGEHQRPASENGAEENLEAAVTANVIECAPDNAWFLPPPASDGRGQAFQAMQDHFRHPACAGSQEHPFCCTMLDLLVVCRRERPAGSGAAANDV